MRYDFVVLSEYELDTNVFKTYPVWIWISYKSIQIVPCSPKKTEEKEVGTLKKIIKKCN